MTVCAVESTNKGFHSQLTRQGAAQHLRSAAEFTHSASILAGRLSVGVHGDMWGPRFWGLVHAAARVPVMDTASCFVQEVNQFDVGKWVHMPLEFLDPGKAAAGTKLWDFDEHLSRRITKCWVMPSVMHLLELLDKYVGEPIDQATEVRDLLWAGLADDAPSWGNQYTDLFERSSAEILEDDQHTFDILMDTFQSFHTMYPLEDAEQRDSWLRRLEIGVPGIDGNINNGCTVKWQYLDIQARKGIDVMGCLCADYQLRGLCTHSVGWVLRHKMVVPAEAFLPENIMPAQRGGPGRPATWSTCPAPCLVLATDMLLGYCAV
jgi:hypothetical protein